MASLLAKIQAEIMIFFIRGIWAIIVVKLKRVSEEIKTWW